MNKGFKQNILLVDDLAENLMTLAVILEGEDRNIVKARSGNEALEFLAKFEFAVVLRAVKMPGMDSRAPRTSPSRRRPRA